MRAMKKALWAAWALVPVAVLAFHAGPGSRYAADSRAGAFSRASVRLERAGDAEGSLDALTKALEALPPDAPAETRRALELRAARAQIDCGQLLEGMGRMETLVSELDAEGKGAGAMANDARSTLASGAYYAAWVMRLEGASSDEWKPVAERARQGFRLLAERAAEANHPEAGAHQRNLESAIRLEQMDLTELVALPLPKQCSCCGKNLSQRCREQRLSKCKGGQGDSADARSKIKQAGQTERQGVGW